MARIRESSGRFATAVRLAVMAAITAASAGAAADGSAEPLDAALERLMAETLSPALATLAFLAPLVEWRRTPWAAL